jgi:hypothetical protein
VLKIDVIGCHVAMVCRLGGNVVALARGHCVSADAQRTVPLQSRAAVEIRITAVRSRFFTA